MENVLGTGMAMWVGGGMPGGRLGAIIENANRRYAAGRQGYEKGVAGEREAFAEGQAWELGLRGLGWETK